LPTIPTTKPIVRQGDLMNYRVVIVTVFSLFLASKSMGDVWRFDASTWNTIPLNSTEVEVYQEPQRSIMRVSAPSWSGALNTTVDWPVGLEISRHFRYDISGEVRGVGDLNQEHAVRLLVQGTRGNGDVLYLTSRRNIGFWRVTEEFQRFRIQQQIVENWPENRVKIQFTPHVPIQPDYIELTGLWMDVAYPPEMVTSKEVNFLDTERALPLRFSTHVRRGLKVPPTTTENIMIRTGSVYHLYLPIGIRIVAAGSDPEAYGPDGSKSTTDALFKIDLGEVHRIGDQTYQGWELTPTHAKHNDDWVGPVYLDTSLPEGTKTEIYYRTSWTTGHYEGSWDQSGKGALRQMEIEVKAFPRVARPQHVVSGLGWMAAASVRAFPNFFETYGSLGFNHVPTLKPYSGFRHRRNEQEPYPDIAPQEVALFEEARCLGFGVMGSDSPFNYHWFGDTFSLDTTTGKPITDRATSCPAFGLPSVDETKYDTNTDSIVDQDDKRYIDQLHAMRRYYAVVQPEYLMLDSEAWGEGAKVALGNDPNHPGGCLRCNDYLSNYRLKPGNEEATMQQALNAMAVERTDHFAQVLVEGGVPVPRMGYYHSAGDFSYMDVIRHLSIAESDPSRIGHWPLYTANPAIIRNKFDPLHVEAVETGTEFLPILDASPRGLVPYKNSAALYDRINETLGSGAPGVEYWPYKAWTSNDFYYHALAIKHILPVEHIIVDSEPFRDLEVFIDSESSAYDVRASAVKKGNEYVILVSGYGQRGNNGLMDEDPLWIGNVVVVLPDMVSGTPISLADGLPAGFTVEPTNAVTIDFQPGVDGARTALFYLCNTSIGTCPEPGLPPVATSQQEERRCK
jgi:hypothetical protein